MNFLDQIIFDGVSLDGANLSLIKVKGDDALSFLQGQTTNDVSALQNGEGHLNTVLNIQGKIEAVFYVGKIQDEYFLILESEQKQSLLDRLNKYLIMEDVVFEELAEQVSILTGLKGIVWAKEYNMSQSFIAPFCNDMVSFSFSSEVNDYFEKIDEKLLDRWKFLTQWNLGSDLVGKLINDTRLNEWAISYSKGCFLGQEVVAKIQNNRGSSYYPAFYISSQKSEDYSLENRKVFKVIDSKTINNLVYHSVELFRDYRVDKKEISNGQVLLGYPLKPFHNLEDKFFAFYEYALKQSNHYSNNELALDILDCCIKYAPEIYDAYEMAGVIQGNLGNYKKAVEYMDQLLEKNPQSIMAHTNKSLFFMKMGNIEKAEEEKAKATLKSFEQNAKSDKERDDIKKKEDAEILRKEKMFKEVLAIDEHDETAHYGLGEIALSRGQFKLAIDHLSKALAQNKKLSSAYLKLGKAYLNMNNSSKALEIFKEGLEIAAAQGDMMPANEMQRLMTSTQA